jgi:hypothetical protein
LGGFGNSATAFSPIRIGESGRLAHPAERYPSDGTSALVKKQKSIQSAQIASHRDSPSCAVRITVQLSQPPGGTNRIAAMPMEGVIERLKVDIQNSKCG